MIRSLRILLLVCATALLPAGAVGCGGSSSGAQPSSGGAKSSQADGGPSSYIDNERVERAIERSVLQQRRRQVFVSCPALVKIKKGGTFTCLAPTRRGNALFRVTMKDARGHVHYEAVRR